MSLKCPNCGGQVVYDPQSAKVVCEFCGQETAEGEFVGLEGRREYDRENEETFLSKDAETQPAPEEVRYPDEFDEFMEAKIYHCKSCGAELLLTGTEASTFCGFCGSSTIVFERVSKEARPKWILPFKLTREEALDSIKKHFLKGEYIPSKIRELTVDKVHGIYMPYWLFDTYIRRSMMVEAHVHKEGTYRYVRDASCCFRKLTLDASLRLNNEMSRRLEPFHTEELVAFDVAYLSGYYADRYDVPKEALKNANVKRCRTYLDKAILDSCLDEIRERDGRILKYVMKDVQEECNIEKVEYALLPAYFVNIKYNRGRELVIVNGQTGKVVANLPYERKRIVKMIFKNALLICPFFLAVTYSMLSYNLYPALILWVILAFLFVVSGVADYKKYKRGRYRMSTVSMNSYANDREDKA